MSEDSKEKTAFISHEGLFQCIVIPFDLSHSEFIHVWTIDAKSFALKAVEWSLDIWTDELLIYSKTFEDQLDLLQQVLAPQSRKSKT